MHTSYSSTVLLLGLAALLATHAACTPTPEGDRPPTSDALLFEDRGTGNWQDQWFLDGARARVVNSAAGMEFSAGPEAHNDTCHAVLWTKATFSGDLSIEYDYTRTDTSTRFVNILYFMATGEGSPEYPADITLWNDKRVVPHMRTYFRHMRAYHISYAAFGADYIRLRRYDPGYGRLKGTDIGEDHFNTGLFLPGVTYHVKVTKLGGRIEMSIQNKDKPADRLRCTWDVSALPTYNTGRIGLRHMYTRSARYQNFKVSRLVDSN